VGIKTLALATALIFGTGAASAAVVTNGSFELDPGVVSQGVSGHGRGAVFSQLPEKTGRNWGIWTSGVAGWSSDANGIEFQTERTLGPNLTPSDGNYYVELDTRRNSRIFQNVDLNPGRYNLSFDYAPRVNSTDSNAISVTLDGYVNELVSNSYSGGARSWTTFNYGFDVNASGLVELGFSARGASNSLGGLLDNVNISVVPLPGGLVFLLSALAGFGVLRRSQTAA
jgi:hypothetical protein